MKKEMRGEHAPSFFIYQACTCGGGRMSEIEKKSSFPHKLTKNGLMEGISF